MKSASLLKMIIIGEICIVIKDDYHKRNPRHYERGISQVAISCKRLIAFLFLPIIYSRRRLRDFAGENAYRIRALDKMGCRNRYRQ